jgi:hypothetical protein
VNELKNYFLEAKIAFKKRTFQNQRIFDLQDNHYFIHKLLISDIKESVLQKSARNFSSIILSHNLGTSLRQNNKKIGGHGDYCEDMIFRNLTWGLTGISTLRLFKKNRLKIF